MLVAELQQRNINHTDFGNLSMQLVFYNYDFFFFTMLASMDVEYCW